MQIRFIMLLSNELLHLIRWMAIREQKNEDWKTPYYQSAEYVRLSTAIKSCHNHYCGNDSGLKASLQIQTLQNLQKGLMKAVRWRTGTRADGDSDGGGDDDATAIATEEEQSCTSPRNKNKKQLRYSMSGDIPSQVLMRSKLDKASRSVHTVLNTAMRNAIMIIMVWWL